MIIKYYKKSELISIFYETDERLKKLELKKPRFFF